MNRKAEDLPKHAGEHFGAAIASQTLNTALKKEEMCIAINRKAEDLPKLTQQDFQALAEHAARVLKAESLGLLDGRDVNPATLACLDNIDENPRAKRQCSWDLLDPATVDDYLRDGHKLLKHHASEKGGGRCGK
jgi:hypothetical protein